MKNLNFGITLGFGFSQPRILTNQTSIFRELLVTPLSLDHHTQKNKQNDWDGINHTI